MNKIYKTAPGDKYGAVVNIFFFIISLGNRKMHYQSINDRIE